MACLDWSQCPAVESVPGKLSGAWVLKDTRMPVAAIFDNNPSKIGLSVGELAIQDEANIPKIVSQLGLKIGVMAVPPSAAQAVAEALVKGGVRSILNYAPITLSLSEGVHVHYIDPVIGLQAMTYYLAHKR